MTDIIKPDQFPTADREAWLALVEKALAGGKFDEQLVAHSDDGIRIEPLYTRSEGEAAAARAGLPGEQPFRRGSLNARQALNESASLGWDIRQRYAGSNPQAVNVAVLDDLQGGVNSITLQIAAPGQFGLTAHMDAIACALEGVHLQFAPVGLLAGDQYIGAAASLAEIWDRRGMTAIERLGAINADPLGHLARTGALEDTIGQALDLIGQFTAQSLGNWPNVTLVLADGKPYHEAGGSEAQELAAMLATLVEYLRTIEEQGARPDTALPFCAIGLTSDADMFVTIAKLRAARQLVWRVAAACGAGAAAGRVQMQVESSERMMSSQDPHLNMLRTTVACAAAALGGADAVTVLPFTWPLGVPDGFARRMARNTQIILQEESSLGRVLDAAGGSFYVERLTEDLARKAWEIFQTIEARGGMAEALASGMIADQIAALAAARASELTSGKRELTGITSFPNLSSSANAGAAPGAGSWAHLSPHPDPTPVEYAKTRLQPLVPRRLGAAFEQLRQASDQHLANSGARPRIFLAALGKPADFSARLGFARNLFASGGIEGIGGEGADDTETIIAQFTASKARIACICSSDTLYLDHAAETARALRRAGAETIYLAGRPGANKERYSEAGIGAFLFKGCDRLALLTSAQARLGLQLAI